MDGGLAHAVITLTIADRDGKQLLSTALEMGSDAEEVALVGVSPLKRIQQLTVILAVACVLVWLLAIGRHLLLRKH